MWGFAKCGVDTRLALGGRTLAWQNRATVPAARLLAGDACKNLPGSSMGPVAMSTVITPQM
jgi:hypothetical protein